MGCASTTGGSPTALQIVESLRTAMGSGSPAALEAVTGRLDTMEGALSKVLSEHSGMADELLRVYEQLGIVFEVTRQLPSVRTEREVLDVFVRSLLATYPKSPVTVVEENADGGLAVCEEAPPLPPWVQAAVTACRDERRVVVAERPQDKAKDGTRQRPGGEGGTFGRVMCGPIFAGDAFVCTLLLGQDVSAEAHGLHSPAVSNFDASDMLLLESLSVFCGDMIRNFRLVAELRQLSVDMVRVLISAIEQKDEYTSGHSTRVGIYAVLLGRDQGLDTADLQMLEWSALLHDIGKIGIRDEVLKKPGRLTDREFEHIKEHPVRSYDVVREVPQLASALDGVVYHHEHWDGGGYPNGLAGEEIPLQARLIQVADIFDALTSSRSYRRSHDWLEALSILRAEAGKTADPMLVARFDALIRRMAKEQPRRLQEIMATHRSDHTASEETPAAPPGRKVSE